MSAWQPIKTAPKDGTIILIYPHLLTCWWERGDEEWLTTNIPLNDDWTIADDWTDAHGKFFCVYADQYGMDPTHWMPLPDPPLTPATSPSSTKGEG